MHGTMKIELIYFACEICFVLIINIIIIIIITTTIIIIPNSGSINVNF